MVRGLMVRAVLIAVLLLLPAGAGFWLFNELELQERATSLADNGETLNRIIAQYSRLSQPQIFFQQIAVRLQRAFVRGKNPARIINGLPKGTARLYLFSAEGKRRPVEGIAEEMVLASEKCYFFIRKMAGEKEWLMSARDQRLAESFLGSFMGIRYLSENSGKLVSLEPYGVPRLAGIFAFRSRAGENCSFILIVDHMKISRFALIEQARRKVQRRYGPSYNCGFFDFHREFRETSPEAERCSQKARDLFSESQTDSLVRTPDKTWSFHAPDRRFLLFCEMPSVPSHVPVFIRHPSLLGIGLLLFGGLCLLTHILDLRGISIRIQITLLFSLASLGSIVALLGFAARYVDSRQNALIRERFEQTWEILEKADASFPLFQRRLSARYKKATKNLYPCMNSEDQISAQFSGTRRLQKRISIVVFNREGEIVFKTRSPADGVLEDAWGRDYERTMAKVAQYCIKVQCLIMEKGTIANDPSFDKLSSLVRRVGNEMDRNHGLISSYPFGKRNLTVFFDYVLGNDGLAAGVVWITHENLLVENLYLEALTKRLSSFRFLKSFPFTLFPVSFSGGVHPLGLPPRRGGPEKQAAALPPAIVQEMNDSLSQMKSPVYRRLQIAGRNYILTGNPSRQLSSSNLFLLSPLSAIEGEARSLSGLFRLFSGLIFLFAVSLSIVFSRLLLKPMEEISEGLRNLSRSDFHKKVEVTTGDEFQKIAGGINQILEEMNELSIAKTIQEHLFPAGPIVSGKVSCRGWTRSPSDIGGEIFDYQEIGEDRMVLWIAGAKGHSIGSALLLAMLKMAIRLLISLNPPDPQTIVRGLHHHFQARIKSEEAINLLVGIFEKSTGGLSLAVQGNFCLGSVLEKGCDGRILFFSAGAAAEGKSVEVPSSKDGGVLANRPDGDVFAGLECRYQMSSQERVFLFSSGCFSPWPSEFEGKRKVQPLLNHCQNLPLGETGPFLLSGLEQDSTEETRTILVFEWGKE